MLGDYLLRADYTLAYDSVSPYLLFYFRTDPTQCEPVDQFKTLKYLNV